LKLTLTAKLIVGLILIFVIFFIASDIIIKWGDRKVEKKVIDTLVKQKLAKYEDLKNEVEKRALFLSSALASFDIFKKAYIFKNETEGRNF